MTKEQEGRGLALWYLKEAQKNLSMAEKMRDYSGDEDMFYPGCSDGTSFSEIEDYIDEIIAGMENK